MPEARRAVPANSISRRVHDEWDGGEGAKFAEKTKQLFGERSDEYFLATRVMDSLQEEVLRGGGSGNGSPGQVWAVPVAVLGEGTFGTVGAVDVPTLGKSCAVKRVKKAVSF